MSKLSTKKVHPLFYLFCQKDYVQIKYKKSTPFILLTLFKKL